MFAARGIAVSFSIFVLVYAGLSLLVCMAWRKLLAYGRRHSAEHEADVLFAARVSPFIVAVFVTLTLAVPSFLLLEPRAGDEGLSGVPVALCVCGFAVVLIGIWKAASAVSQTSRNIERWKRAADPAPDHEAMLRDLVCVRRVGGDAPPLTAAGIFRPSVWLSYAAEFVLGERELQSALRHELAHVRRRDNLRKLILRFVAFPGMTGLENAWREATEMAADDAAVTTASEALDLAAAVIKLSCLVSREAPSELTTGLVHSPASSLHARVERLLSWSERREIASSENSVILPLCAAAAVVFTLVLTYGELLVRVHAATEWLVR